MNNLNEIPTETIQHHEYPSQAGHYVVAGAIVLAAALLIYFRPAPTCCCCCQRPATVVQGTTTFGETPLAIPPGSRGAPGIFNKVERHTGPLGDVSPVSAPLLEAPAPALPSAVGEPQVIVIPPDVVFPPQDSVSVPYTVTFPISGPVRVSASGSSLAWMGLGVAGIGGLVWLRKSGRIG